MALRLYADECVDARIVSGLRGRGVDIVSAQDVGLLGADDMTHISRANSMARVIVTADTDFLAIIPGDGLFFVKPTTSIGEAIGKLESMAKNLTAEDVRSTVQWI